MQSPLPKRREPGKQETTPSPLRLAIGREGVGLELCEPLACGPLRVTELSVKLEGLKFPLDVSGGVERFRHRHGALTRLEVELPLEALSGFARPHLAGLVSPGPPDLFLRLDGAGLWVAVTPPAGDPEEGGAGLAFRLVFLATDDHLTLHVTHVEGWGLPELPEVLALRCVARMLGDRATRRGAAFEVKHVARTLARTLLPGLGARAPSTAGFKWTGQAVCGETLLLFARVGGLDLQPTLEAQRARETSSLLEAADDCLMRGDIPEARTRLLDVLERAPKHPDVATRLAGLDAHSVGRSEAALATLRDFANTPSLLLAELLANAGDRAAAVVVFARVGEQSPYPRVASRAFVRASELCDDDAESVRLLDRALSAFPKSESARKQRARLRLRLGSVEDALADMEHLEASARGSEAKYRVWLEAGRLWQSQNLHHEAVRLYERALRYAPDSHDALFGLGQALSETGNARGIDLLTRALALAENARVGDEHAIAFQLARFVATLLSDLPAAIARARSIPDRAAASFSARYLEADLRKKLGDLVGASRAYVRMRELSDLGASHVGAEEVVRALLEAAEFERGVTRDLRSAQRTLEAALRLSPEHPIAREQFREMGREILQQSLARPPTEKATPPKEASFHEVRAQEAPGPRAPAAPPPPEEEDEDVLAARVEELTRKLQGDPTRHDIADELAAVLERLGRGHELLALLMGRLEECPPELRPALVDKARGALGRLEAVAREQGRAAEADLFASVLQNLHA